MKKPNVGVVGLGIMGGAMATNLLKEGFQVFGCDVANDAVKAFEKMGGTACGSPATTAERCEVIISSLPSIAAYRNVFGGDNGFSHDTENPSVILETSTLPLSEKEWGAAQLKNTNIDLLDCPISGTGVQAVTKDIVLYVSGTESAAKKCQPVFDAIARATHFLGDFGNGSRMKFVADLLVAVHNVAAAEAMVLGMKSGLDPQRILDVISDGAGSSRMMEIRGPAMVRGEYNQAGMKVDVWQKDLAIISDYAREIGCPTPTFSATHPLYSAALSQGHEKEDTAVVCAVLEKMAGISRD